MRARRERNGPLASRCVTIFSASPSPMPEMRRKSGSRSGVDVDANCVHAILDYRVERPRQLVFGEVVLVLADPDRLGVDLDQFGQRIL